MDRTKLCPPDHKHGRGITCYRDHRCGCADCRSSNTSRTQVRRKQIAYGRYDGGYTLAGAPRRHIGILLAAGMTLGAIAAASGVGRTTVESIWLGRVKPGGGRTPLKRVLNETARRVMSLEPDLLCLPSGVMISNRGMQRRARALVAIGWSQGKLSKRLGIVQSRMWRILHEDFAVPIELSVRFSELYEELWNSPPPSNSQSDRAAATRAEIVARLHGWLPPLAWDDIDTDDEPAVVDGEPIVDDVAIDLALRGEHVRLTREERHLAIQLAHERGYSLEETAQVLDITSRTVLRVLHVFEITAPTDVQVAA